MNGVVLATVQVWSNVITYLYSIIGVYSDIFHVHFVIIFLLGVDAICNMEM